MTDKKKLLEFISVNNKPCKFVGDDITKRAVDFNELADFILDLFENNPQPTFNVGEYYSTREGMVFRLNYLEPENMVMCDFLVSGDLIDVSISMQGSIFSNKEPATAEQIAEFKRAEGMYENT